MRGHIDLIADRWLSDPMLRSCTPHDRGILIDLMCLASFGTPYGFVTAGRKPMPVPVLCCSLRIGPEEWEAAKARLLELERISVNERDGSIFIPRMVKDGQIRESTRSAGKLGGNPSLLPQQEAEAGKRTTAITVAYYMTKLPAHLTTKEVRAAVTEWLDYRRRKRAVMTPEAVTRQVNVLARLNPPDAVRWITCAIDKQWVSFYPPPASWQEKRSAADENAVRDYARQIRDRIDHEDSRDIARLYEKIQNAVGVDGLKAAKALSATIKKHADIWEDAVQELCTVVMRNTEVEERGHALKVLGMQYDSTVRPLRGVSVSQEARERLEYRKLLGKEVAI